MQNKTLVGPGVQSPRASPGLGGWWRRWRAGARGPPHPATDARGAPPRPFRGPGRRPLRLPARPPRTPPRSQKLPPPNGPAARRLVPAVAGGRAGGPARSCGARRAAPIRGGPGERRPPAPAFVAPSPGPPPRSNSSPEIFGDRVKERVCVEEEYLVPSVRELEKKGGEASGSCRLLFCTLSHKGEPLSRALSRAFQGTKANDTVPGMSCIAAAC